jgi:hypothetical protein
MEGVYLVDLRKAGFAGEIEAIPQEDYSPPSNEGADAHRRFERVPTAHVRHLRPPLQ